MKITLYSLLMASTLSMTACGEAKETEATSNHESSEASKDTTTIEVAADENPDEIVSKYNYDKDWEMIKEAILKKDIPGLGAWAGSDDFDAEMFIQMAQEDFVQAALKTVKYDDLRIEEMDGEVYLVFYAEITGMDEEGYEVGSSISLYMLQGDPSLQLQYFIAAG